MAIFQRFVPLALYRAAVDEHMFTAIPAGSLTLHVAKPPHITLCDDRYILAEPACAALR